MYFLEVLLIIFTVCLIGFAFAKKIGHKTLIISTLFITFLVLILHIFIDGIRWQLYPIYFVIIVLGVISTHKLIKNVSLNITLRKIVLVIVISFTVISGLTLFSFPIYQIPEPDGEYLIGTQSLNIIDPTRNELYSDNSQEYRRFKIQIWYPAETIDGYDQVPWLEDGLPVARSLSKDTGLPAFVLDHTVKIMSNSYLAAPISSSEESYPVIIISHGWRGFKNLHTDFAEELASQGYIVVGIDHTFGSVATVFAENDIEYLNLDALPPREETPDFLEYANKLVNTYALDVVKTLDVLEANNLDTTALQVSTKMDLSRVGLLGHSTGGGADVSVALSDDRIDAVIGLDAWVEPIDQGDIIQGLSIPSLFLRSGDWEEGENNENLKLLTENNSYTSLLYQIDGTTHYDFSMVYMYSPLTSLIGFTGDVEGRYLNSMLEYMIVDFFNVNLQNETESSLYSDIYEEVNIITFE